MAARGRSLLESRWAGLLVPFSWVYGRAASRRRARLTRARVRLPAPVISVGNITCGGTGKTPVVEMLVRRLLERDFRPAILSRGYGAGREGPGDEARLYALNLPGVPHYINPDRIASGRQAIAEGAQVLVLDDGFQHARLARDLDLVLIDALNPFGGGRVLPAGLLREPLRALRCTDLIGITRNDLVSPSVRGILRGLLRDRFPGIPRIELELEPRCWDALGPGRPLEARGLSGKRVAAFAGIGNPEAFRLQVQALGLEVAAWMTFPDHHRYRAADLEGIRRRARAKGAEAVVTTQKDAVKLPSDSAQGTPWWVLRIAARVTAGEEELRRALDRALGGRRVELPA